MSQILWNYLRVAPVVGLSLAISTVAMGTAYTAIAAEGPPGTTSNKSQKVAVSHPASPVIAQASPAPAQSPAPTAPTDRDTSPNAPTPGQSPAPDPNAPTDRDIAPNAPGQTPAPSPGETPPATTPDTQTPAPTTPDTPAAPNTGVTSVSQLSDVDPNSYAFQALQSLVERYGCIAGYPDGTFRGNRALTRYEFAAGLNACITSVASRIQSPADQATIDRLREEFAAELATLQGRADNLEARTTDLEAQQFSTTTKLQGEVVFAPAITGGDERAIASGATRTGAALTSVDDQAIFGFRARLNFDTSFTGRDRLRVRVQARDIPNFSAATGTQMSRLNFDGTSFAGAPNNNVTFEIDDLFYQIPLGSAANPKGSFILSAYQTDYNDFVETFAGSLNSSARGAISRFGRHNPIYRQGDGTGAMLIYNLTPQVGVNLGYLVNNPDSFTNSEGFIGSQYSALAQLVFKPAAAVSLGLTYVRAYYDGDSVNLTGSTGSTFATSPFGADATTANHYGAEVSFRLSPRFIVSGWGGFSQADRRSGPAGTVGQDAQIINYAVQLALPDLFKEGGLGGLILGQPPKVFDNDFAAREDAGTSYHAEAFYRFPVSDKISITPGVFVLFNPENNSANSLIYVGTIRTTFTF